MAFENHLCSVSRAASQRLSILRKSWRVFHDRLLLGRYFRYVPVRVTRTLVAHRYTYASSGCKPHNAAGLLFSSQYLSGMILLTMYVFDGVELAGFKSRVNAFLLA